MIAWHVRRSIPVALGALGLLSLWIVGGRAGWGSGMVVTPAEALKPITGDSRDVYARATVATIWAAARAFRWSSTGRALLR